MEVYDGIKDCKISKETWDALKIHHERTSHVNEARIDIRVKRFETL